MKLAEKTWSKTDWLLRQMSKPLKQTEGVCCQLPLFNSTLTHYLALECCEWGEGASNFTPVLFSPAEVVVGAHVCPFLQS